LKAPTGVRVALTMTTSSDMERSFQALGYLAGYSAVIRRAAD
jgi:hypothetical protein